MDYITALKNLLEKAEREHDKDQARQLAELLRINQERGNK
jgi:hypothetical protein